MHKYEPRSYRNLKQFWREGASLAANWRVLPAVVRGRMVPSAFRERLMLVVTAVNRCRYCAYIHAGAALLAGVSKEEAQMLLSGTVEHCPEEEIPALLYAQHWAEADGEPDPEARRKMVETYGTESAKQIEAVLRMIRIGNLTGNTLDRLLDRLRRADGRLGP